MAMAIPQSHQLQQTPLCVHIISAFFEIMFVVSELVVGIHFISLTKSKLIPFNHQSNQALNILFDSFAYILLLRFIIFSVAFNIGLSTKTVAKRLGLNAMSNITKMVFIIFCLHCLGVIVNLILFSFCDEWLFTLSNITDSSGDRFDFYRIFDLLICSPIREEIVHRGLIFLILWRRVNPTNNDKLIAIKRCMLISAIIFGAIHFLNLFGRVYSAQYVALQVFVGCVVSLFYTLRMVISATLWEPILLHCINNAFSVFIDFKSDNVTNPLVRLPS